MIIIKQISIKTLHLYLEKILSIFKTNIIPLSKKQQSNTRLRPKHQITRIIYNKSWYNTYYMLIIFNDNTYYILGKL